MSEQISGADNLFSLSFNLFLADHHLHSSTQTFCCIVSSSFQVSLTVSLPDLHSPSVFLSCSKSSNRHTSLAPWHLKNRCPQSSFILKHMGQIVSFFTPVLAIFLRTAKLLCAKRQINILTLFGSGSFQILPQSNFSCPWPSA